MKRNGIDVPQQRGESPRPARGPNRGWDMMRATAEDAELVATSEEEHSPAPYHASPDEEQAQVGSSEADVSSDASVKDAMSLSPGKERARTDAASKTIEEDEGDAPTTIDEFRTQTREIYEELVTQVRALGLEESRLPVWGEIRSTYERMQEDMDALERATDPSEQAAFEARLTAAQDSLARALAERAGEEAESLANGAEPARADAEPGEPLKPDAGTPPAEEPGTPQVWDSARHTGSGPEYQTNKEWRTKLADLIESARKGGVLVKEKTSAAYEHSAEFLSTRNKQLSASMRNLYAGFKRDLGAVRSGARFVYENPAWTAGRGVRLAYEGTKGSLRYAGYFLRRDIEMSEKGARLLADFKRLTERYNGLDMRHKVYLSTALALGTGVTSGVIASALVGATFTQRALGTSGFFINRARGLDAKIEAKIEAEKHWLLSKDSAAWKRHAYVGAVAGALTAAYTGATLGGSLAFSHYLHEWLYGADHAPATPSHSTASTPEVPKTDAPNAPLSHAEPAGSAAHGSLTPAEVRASGAESAPFHAPHPAAPLQPVRAEDVVKPVSASEHLNASGTTLHADHATVSGDAPELPHTAPSLATEAFKGHGYEYMLKHGMWEQLRHAGLKAEDYFKSGVPADKQSDLYMLLTAKQGDIDRVVDQIARNHHFVLQNEGSVTIDPTAHMTFDTHGNIELNGHAAAPLTAHVTPPLHHPEGHAPATIAPHPHDALAQELSPADRLNHSERMAFEKGPAEMRAWLRSIGFHAHHAATAPRASGAAHASGAPTAHEGAQAGHPLAHPERLEAGKYLTVDVANAHRYVSADGHDVVYGGTSEERAALAFDWVTKDHRAVVYFDKTIRGFFRTHHQLMRAEWINRQGTTVTPFGPGAPIQVNQPSIAPVLQEGAKIPHAPSVDDLQRELPDSF